MIYKGVEEWFYRSYGGFVPELGQILCLQLVVFPVSQFRQYFLLCLGKANRLLRLNLAYLYYKELAIHPNNVAGLSAVQCERCLVDLFYAKTTLMYPAQIAAFGGTGGGGVLVGYLGEFFGVQQFLSRISCLSPCQFYCSLARRLRSGSTRFIPSGIWRGRAGTSRR